MRCFLKSVNYYCREVVAEDGNVTGKRWEEGMG